MSLLKENKIHLHGFTDGFTYNNVDYSLVNYDKDMYELYFKEVQNENVWLMCDLLEFKEDIEHCTKIRQLTNKIKLLEKGNVDARDKKKRSNT